MIGEGKVVRLAGDESQAGHLYEIVEFVGTGAVHPVIETVLPSAEARKALEMKKATLGENFCPRSELEPNLHRGASSAGSVGEILEATEP